MYFRGNQFYPPAFRTAKLLLVVQMYQEVKEEEENIQSYDNFLRNIKEKGHRQTKTTAR